MKAIVITKPGAPGVLELASRDLPEPAKNQVRIRVKAAGINAPDVFQRKGSYPAPEGVPADVPGLEVAGIVDDCHPGAKRWKSGDKVCALLGGGGYSEYVVVDERHCLPVPSTLDFTSAACLPETVFTVWHNLFQRGGLTAGEFCLIHGGSSGIGTTAIQLAKAFSATVAITAGSEAKCEACRKLGADHVINYKSEDFEVVLKDLGVDVVLDMVGGEYIPKNIRLLKEDGRLVFINAMKGGKTELNVLDIMRKRLTITGSTLRKRDPEFKASLAGEVLNNVWPLIESGKFAPVIHAIFPLAEAARAHELMETRQHIGKIALVID